MTVWCGVVDTMTGNIVATSTDSKHGMSARHFARALNDRNMNAAAEDNYYRFHSFEFTGIMYFNIHYNYTLKAIRSNASEFKTLAEKAKKVIVKEAADLKEAARIKELEKINSFDIPEDYKDILRDYFLND